MKKLLCSLALLWLGYTPVLAQYAAPQTFTGILLAAEFSKAASLYRAKEYVMTKILGPTEKPVLFEADALSAASSGELTSLVYNCPEKQKQGMVFAFWGDKWNPAGVTYHAYGFKEFSKEKADELLAKVQTILDTSEKTLLRSDNNIYFQYDDLTFLIYYELGLIQIRVFWNDFDSEWNVGSFNRTKRRLEKKL